MKKIMSLIALLLLQAAGAQTLSEPQKLAATARIWGFLKYYHPQVAAGKYNWDEKLVELLPKVKQAATKEELNTLYINWIDGLGDVPACKKCARKKDDWFEKNFSMAWMQDSSIFTPRLTEKLKHIEANRLMGKNHYAINDPSMEIIIQNEPEYKDFAYPSEEYRMVSLFRYWNIIEYFFPYKYQTDQKWDDVLLEMIPKFSSAKNTIEYQLAMLEATGKVDDSHAFLISKDLDMFFGNYWPPFRFIMIDNKVIVSRLYDKGLCDKEDIRIGDAITHFNGRTIAEIFNERKKYIPASSEICKRRDAPSYGLLNGQTAGLVPVTFERDGIIAEKTITRYAVSDLQKSTPAERPAFKKLDGNIGYVDMGILENSDVKNVFTECKDCRAIILDLRTYPKGTMNAIAKNILPEKKEFAKLIYPDLDYPGKYRPIDKKFDAGGIMSKNLVFKGKVILLVNENTQSQGEFTTMALSTADNAIIVGSNTAGADGDICDFSFPGGYGTRISALGVFYPDGRETQRTGITPDVKVYRTIEGIRAGRDELLDKAIEVANQ